MDKALLHSVEKAQTMATDEGISTAVAGVNLLAVYIVAAVFEGRAGVAYAYVALTVAVLVFSYFMVRFACGLSLLSERKDEVEERVSKMIPLELTEDIEIAHVIKKGKYTVHVQTNKGKKLYRLETMMGTDDTQVFEYTQ